MVNIDQTHSSIPTMVFLPPSSIRIEEIRLRMNEGKSQPWYRLYASAVLELEPKHISERVDAAEAAIHGRLRDLQGDSDHHEERQLMEDAQRTLAFLRRSPEDDAALGTPTILDVFVILSDSFLHSHLRFSRHKACRDWEYKTLRQDNYLVLQHTDLGQIGEDDDSSATAFRSC